MAAPKKNGFKPFVYKESKVGYINMYVNANEELSIIYERFYNDYNESIRDYLSPDQLSATDDKLKDDFKIRLLNAINSNMSQEEYKKFWKKLSDQFFNIFGYSLVDTFSAQESKMFIDRIDGVTSSKIDESVNYFEIDRGVEAVKHANEEYNEFRRNTTDFDARLGSITSSPDAIKISKHAMDFLDELLAEDDSSYHR